MSLIFVDVEAYGSSPVTGRMTEFGAVCYACRETFHGVVVPTVPSENNPAIPAPIDDKELKRSGANEYEYYLHAAMTTFDEWLKKHAHKGKRLIFVSDNPAFDWQWINCAFWQYIGYNPFGHSARRIGDFYAGLTGDFYAASRWKSLRVTKHDHHPVNDAMGNVEAFERMMNGERA